MNEPSYVPVPVSVLVTTTSAAPAVLAGIVQVMEVAETNNTLVHTSPPIVTVAPEAKPVPVITIAVPPAINPDEGERLVIIGGDMKVTLIVRLADR